MLFVDVWHDVAAHDSQRLVLWQYILHLGLGRVHGVQDLLA